MQFAIPSGLLASKAERLKKKGSTKLAQSEKELQTLRYGARDNWDYIEV